MSWFILVLVMITPTAFVIWMDKADEKRKIKGRMECMEIELKEIIFKHKLNKQEREELEYLLSQYTIDHYAEKKFYDRLYEIINTKTYNDLLRGKRR